MTSTSEHDQTRVSFCGINVYSVELMFSHGVNFFSMEIRLFHGNNVYSAELMFFLWN